LTDSKDFSKVLNTYHKRWSNDNKKWLENLAKRNLFGFVLSCLNNADWENEKARIHHTKGLRNLFDKVNKKSWLGKLPTNISSSSGIYFLHSVVMLTKNKKYKNTRQLTRLC
jgi:hypothetical protein